MRGSGAEPMGSRQQAPPPSLVSIGGLPSMTQGHPKSCEMLMELFGCITITNASLSPWLSAFWEMLREAKQCLTLGK